MNQLSPQVHDPFPSLGDLFLGKDGQLPTASLGRLESADRIREAQQGLLEAAKDLEWHGAWRLIKERLPELFDVSVLDLLLAGWEKYALVAEYAEKSRKEPGKTHRVPLHRKRLTSEHHPRIDLLINERVVEELDFTIRLKLDFAGAQLTLENGELRAVRTGECTGSGEVYLRHTQLYKKTFGKLDLPGEVRFRTGLAVPTRQHPYVWGEGPAKAEHAAASVPVGGTRRRARVSLVWASLGTLALGLLIGSQLNRERAPSPVPEPVSPKPVSPAPAVPAPEVPAPAVPEPEVPEPEVPVSAVPAPEVPAPAAPEPEVPAPEVPEPEVPASEEPAPEVPAPAVPKPVVPAPEVPAPRPPAPGAAETATYGLTVVTTPPGARVRIMNVAPVYSPGMRLAPGRYHVRVDHPGHVTEDRWIELVDQNRILNIVLEPERAAAGSGSYPVVIHTDPPDAEISIFRDGRREPFTSGTRLKPGVYEFTVRHDGYRPSVHVLRLEKRDTEITIRLQEEFIH